MDRIEDCRELGSLAKESCRFLQFSLGQYSYNFGFLFLDGKIYRSVKRVMERGDEPITNAA